MSVPLYHSTKASVCKPTMSQRHCHAADRHACPGLPCPTPPAGITACLSSRPPFPRADTLRCMQDRVQACQVPAPSFGSMACLFVHLLVSQSHLMAQLGGAPNMPVHACHAPVSPHGSGAHLLIRLLCPSTSTWCLMHLSCPSVTERWRCGACVFTPVTSEHQYAGPFTCLLSSSTATRRHRHACVHTCRVPVTSQVGKSILCACLTHILAPPRGRTGTPLCSRACCVPVMTQITGWEHLFVHMPYPVLTR